MTDKKKPEAQLEHTVGEEQVKQEVLQGRQVLVPKVKAGQDAEIPRTPRRQNIRILIL